jgi:TnpA family transposase
MPRLKRIK